MSGQHTASGKPIIAGDPHLPTGIPTIGTIGHIEYPGFVQNSIRVIGSPFMAAGYRNGLAVSVTALHPDIVDLYKEKIVGDFYEFDGKLRPLQIRDEVISVRHGSLY